MLLLLLFCLTSTSLCSADTLWDDPEFDNELVSTFDAVDGARTFSFNSTYLLIAVAIGAVIVLAIGVGLYLYDLSFSNTGRTEPIPNNADYDYYYQQQYQNAQYAYPAAQQQSYNQYRLVNLIYPLYSKSLDSTKVFGQLPQIETFLLIKTF